METWSTKLELPADSVEFCPSQPECFVVGTYKLNEETRNRNGAVVAFRRTGDACDRVGVYEVPGVLDLKWSHDNLAVALSDGAVQVRRLLSTDNGAVNIDTIAETGPSEAGSLALAVCWNSMEPEKLTTSYSNGEVSVLRFAESELEHERTWSCHDFEAWTVAWDSTDQHVFYTGGDDCLLKIWDTRSPEGALHGCHCDPVSSQHGPSAGNRRLRRDGFLLGHENDANSGQRVRRRRRSVASEVEPEGPAAFGRGSNARRCLRPALLCRLANSPVCE
ncbi:diphthine methyltransferase isoform X2 [Ixodes scapularis]|uniref:diphthine methyltransferase isoform X2 n=1 Tax=Ixodes scapularis TaxID=6945 RepID=UPI001A9CE412|nr:diphthine methyltransferase isoform X2 [Ixodes scapularis]